MSDAGKFSGVWLALTAIAGVAVGAGGGWAVRRPATPAAPAPAAVPAAPVNTQATTATPAHGCPHGADEKDAAKCPLHYEGDVARSTTRRRRSGYGARCATGCSPPGPSSAARRRPRSSRSA